MPVMLAGISALEILDSRGNPTIAVTVELSNGVRATAQVPSGASTGKHEASELRDGDPGRYGGKGVGRAVANVEEFLQPEVLGMDAEDLPAIDRRLCEIDGSPAKARLGANAILGISCAAARALSPYRCEPLWRTLAGVFGTPWPSVPVPMVNILSGGLHAAHNIEVQDFLVVANGFGRFSDGLHAIVQVHGAARRLLKESGYTLTGVADEGGWGPLLPSNEIALDTVTRAIERAGYRPGEQLTIAIDVASSHFYRDGVYHLQTEQRSLSSSEMIDLLESWTRRYPVVSIEDGLEQDDWTGWRELTSRLGGSVQLVGDDFLVTNPSRLARAVRERAANAVLVKMNQIGTLSETFEVITGARAARFNAVISARSGETEDPFLADLAVASGAGQIKVGSIMRSERLSKYNRLLEIEKYDGLEYARLTIPAGG
jgi:enolase